MFLRVLWKSQLYLVRGDTQEFSFVDILYRDTCHSEV